MHNTILLLSAAFLLAACADDQHATAPSGPRTGAASQTVNAYPPGPSNGAKPSSQPGWTQAITVSSTITVPPASVDFTTAICPVGTTLVGGGFSMQPGFGTPPAVYSDSPNTGGTGWDAGAINTNAPGGSSISVTAFARCAS